MISFQRVKTPTAAAAFLVNHQDNEPELFDKIDKIMLPGDYLAMKLSGEVKTTISGLNFT